jgi:hypothetical protein
MTDAIGQCWRHSEDLDDVVRDSLRHTRFERAPHWRRRWRAAWR